jgi:DNA/RNA-binding domain of Phe-tRNA-synthetase-like protein
MKFIIDPEIFEKFEDTRIGLVVAKNIDNKGRALNILFNFPALEDKIRTELTGADLSIHPKIKVWQEAFIKFGAKPKDQRSSIENLVKSILNGVSLRHINKLVDIYNSISLKYLLPVGGEDLDKTMGDIELTFAGESEQPVLLLGDSEARVPHIGEVIYRDTISAICRRWNWREAERTKLTLKTKNCILVIEEIAKDNDSIINQGTEELANLVLEHCGGQISHHILDKSHNSIDIS